MFLTKSLAGIALVVTACTGSVAALAQDANTYPTKPIRIIAPFSPGGTADVLARAIAHQLGNKYKQSVVVENKPGSGGNVGASEVAKATPDGYTLVLGTIGIHAAYSVYSSLPYDPKRDLQPVIILGGVPTVAVVYPSVPIKTLAELIRYGKEHPGKLNVGSAGMGSSTHMVNELFQQEAGVKFTHIPYRGSSLAMNDLMGGQIELMFELVTTAAPIIKSGKIRALAVTSKERSSVLPEVPTVSETSMPGFEGTGWFTIATSSGVPASIVAKLNKDINEVLSSPETQKTWDSLALQVQGGSVDSAVSFFDSETKKWQKVIKSANIRAN